MTDHSRIHQSERPSRTSRSATVDDVLPKGMSTALVTLLSLAVVRDAGTTGFSTSAIQRLRATPVARARTSAPVVDVAITSSVARVLGLVRPWIVVTTTLVAVVVVATSAHVSLRAA